MRYFHQSKYLSQTHFKLLVFLWGRGLCFLFSGNIGEFRRIYCVYHHVPNVHSKLMLWTLYLSPPKLMTVSMINPFSKILYTCSMNLPLWCSFKEEQKNFIWPHILIHPGFWFDNNNKVFENLVQKTITS